MGIGSTNAPGVSVPEFKEHTENKKNPHGVTASQIGAAAASHNHAASAINSGTLDAARIPSLAASKIGSGTFAIARIPTITIAKGGHGGTTAAAGIYNLINGAGAVTPDLADYIALLDSSGATGGKALLSSLPFAKIQTGSYVGTGTYGSNNPCSLTFDFAPKLVVISTRQVDRDKRCTLIFPIALLYTGDAGDLKEMAAITGHSRGYLYSSALTFAVEGTMRDEASKIMFAPLVSDPYAAAVISTNQKTLYWCSAAYLNSADAGSALIQGNVEGYTYDWIALG